jgi:thiamine pyrophosphate-dependent acetolactate synthase large subunit-like protein
VIASDLHNPDFVRLAESFGLTARRVTSPDELGAALARADRGPARRAVEPLALHHAAAGPGLVSASAPQLGFAENEAIPRPFTLDRTG